jgi:hypothetical protein
MNHQFMCRDGPSIQYRGTDSPGPLYWCIILCFVYKFGCSEIDYHSASKSTGFGLFRSWTRRAKLDFKVWSNIWLIYILRRYNEGWRFENIAAPGRQTKDENGHRNCPRISKFAKPCEKTFRFEVTFSWVWLKYSPGKMEIFFWKFLNNILSFKSSYVYKNGNVLTFFFIILWKINT